MGNWFQKISAILPNSRFVPPHHDGQLANLERALSRLDRRVDELQAELDLHREHSRHYSGTIDWLARNHHSVNRSTAEVDQQHAAAEPLISVVMPVRNRAEVISRAIESVVAQTYDRWELIVVDDGSSDETMAVVQSYADDDRRVRLISQESRGVCAARNRALQAVEGEIVTYLDSDNLWYSSYLAEVAATFQPRHIECAFAAQLVEDVERKLSYVRGMRFDRDAYLRAGGIDLNAFAHRVEVYYREGGFDETLTRLVDWDLIARYTQHQDPTPMATIAGRYFERSPESISTTAGFHYNSYRIRRRWLRPVERPFKVLYVVWDYPQLTESYVRWEIACLRRFGVEIEVWSEIEQTIAPYESEVPVHHGSLAEAIQRVRPQALHVHWLNTFERHRNTLAASSLPVTVRGHGYEFASGLAHRVKDDGIVVKVFLFPHFGEQIAAHPKVHFLPAAVNGDLYYPEDDPDPWLVVRTAAAKPAKNLEAFIETAKRCPQHRFVLILGRINNLYEYTEQLLTYNREQGSPVEILVDLPTEEAAAWVRKAGIYLHTYGTEEPFGQPISIAEAMACGALTLVPNVPGAAEYVASVGKVYNSIEEAARLINEDTTFERWADYRQQAVEHAYRVHGDLNVLEPIVHCWQDAIDHHYSRVAFEGAHEAELADCVRFVSEEESLRTWNNFGGPQLAHYLGVEAILRSWNAEPVVCRAGLLHSIYSHGWLQADPSRRELIQGLIGEKAEHLVYTFCMTKWRPFDRWLDVSPSIKLPSSTTLSEHEITSTQYRQLCLLIMADWLEKASRLPQPMRRPEVYAELAEQLGPTQQAAFRSMVGSGYALSADDIVHLATNADLPVSSAEGSPA